ncbi:hypothetical protein P9112_007895 [Eukaryota sp. TZLM1-RC]
MPPTHPCIANDGIPEQETVTVMSAKQIKQFVRPRFEANPEEFYPTTTMTDHGFSRAQCGSCKHYYWKHSDKMTCCGDSNCVGEYQFIGTGVGKGANGTKITYQEAWAGYERIFTTNPVPCTAIDRFPVVARWRSDIDFVAAGIFCFQPYCVTGELEPPANPLICPQFCLRFNDLDSIGLSGRHHSGFVMIGNQVFNYPDNFVYFKEEVVAYHLRWLTEELGIDLDDVTLIEDVWSGGGNLGPCIEIFVKGLEVGNLVFMEYRYGQDGSLHKLDVQVVDVGIGLERIPWLINGSLTSYLDVYPSTLNLLSSMVKVDPINESWKKYAPYSCLLNIDECEDVDKAYESVAQRMGLEKEELIKEIMPVRDLYIVCDHTRTVLMAIQDGCLPSSVGGGYNLRNLLRRVFSTLRKRNWWDLVGLEGLFKLFDSHRDELAGIYGPFGQYSSFNSIIEIEYERWRASDDEAKKKLSAVLKKTPQLTLNHWIQLVTSQGLSPDKIAEISKQEVPSNLYYEIAERQDKVAKKELQQLYETASFPATDELFYELESQDEWEAKVVGILENADPHHTGKRNVILLNQTCIYPTSGGQDHDTGRLLFDNGVELFVQDAIRVGKVVLHVTSEEIPDSITVGATVNGVLDRHRRNQLRQHHTATHIIHAACVETLGPHVWQNGAKKTEEIAHLDITHYRSLTRREELNIEIRANEIVNSCIPINISNRSKKEAEAQHGFSLYQGGVVPGNTLRVVDINGVDQEACCGTHCQNTGEVGTIRLTRSNRISDGVVRLYFVSGAKGREYTANQAQREYELCQTVAMQPEDLKSSVAKYFEGYKRFDKFADSFVRLVLNHLTVPSVDQGNVFVRFDPPNPSMFSMQVPPFSEKLKELDRSVVFVGSTFIYGLIGNSELVEADKLKEMAVSQAEKLGVTNAKKAFSSRNRIQWTIKEGKKRVKKVVEGVLEVSLPTLSNTAPFVDYLSSKGFTEFLP